MKKIALIIPTRHRIENLKKLLKNIKENLTEVNTYFVHNADDKETPAFLETVKDEYDFTVFVTPGRHRASVNYGCDHSTEPFIFAGADDIAFHKDADLKMLKTMEDPKINVTGGMDDWVESRSKIHVGHPLVRRTYIEELGAAWGEPGNFYPSVFDHFHSDLEVEQLAHSRGCFKLTEDAFVEHNHYHNGKVQLDDTYRHTREVSHSDTIAYKKRLPHFEWWDWGALTKGKAEPSKLRKQRLSVVMPIWNCKAEAQQTIESLNAKTKNKWELILIDDASTEFDGKEFLEKCRNEAYKGGWTTVKIKAHDKQMYCNASWNDGVAMATGDYVAVINSDLIFLTPEWDELLLENVELGYEVISPFTTTAKRPKPYQTPDLPSPNHYQRMCGYCYLMTRPLVAKAFPIPSRYVHWCGDNHVGNIAKTSIYDSRVCVHHLESRSSAKVDGHLMSKITQQDLKNYFADTMDWSIRGMIKG